MVSVDEQDGPIEMAMIQAVVRSLAVNAQKGNQRAQKLFIGLLQSLDRESQRARIDFVDAAIEYKLDWESELERRRKMDISDAPEPLPHPDHVVIDFNAGSVRIAGPMTKEEKRTWDRLKARTQESLETIGKLNQLLQESPGHLATNLIVEEIVRERHIHEIISTIIPK